MDVGAYNPPPPPLPPINMSLSLLYWFIYYLIIYSLGCVDKYCVLCFNASNCYECVAGYFLQDDSTCQGKVL